MAAISELISSDAPSATEAKIAEGDDIVEVNALPPGKRYHYFGELVFRCTCIFMLSYVT